MKIICNAWLGFVDSISIRSLDQSRSYHWHYAIANTIMKKMPFKKGRRKRITYKEYAQRYFT